MIKLGEKIKIYENEKESQEICIFSDGIVIFTTDNSYSWENREIIKYDKFVEPAEIKKTVIYDEVFYYDENGREHLLADKEIVGIEYQLCLQYKKDVKVSVYSSETKNETFYNNLLINNLDLGLEIVKKINRYIKMIEKAGKNTYTNSKGISYYKRGKTYYRNIGWLEFEITKEEYERGIKND